MIDLNATQAAIRAGYSVSTAKEIGAQNLTKLNINSAIAKEMLINVNVQTAIAKEMAEPEKT